MITGSSLYEVWLLLALHVFDLISICDYNFCLCYRLFFFLGTGCMGPFSDVSPHVVSDLFLACIRLSFSVNWTSSLGVPQRIASSSASLSEAPACCGSMIPNSAAGPALSMIAFALRF